MGVVFLKIEWQLVDLDMIGDSELLIYSLTEITLLSFVN